METKVKKFNWKSLYKENINRKYNEIVKIESDKVSLESSPIKKIKEHKLLYLISTIVCIVILLLVFLKNINIFFIALAFFVVIAGLIMYFDSYKMVCTSDGLYIKFGFQETMIPYNILKNVYISKNNDYTFGIPIRDYNITVRYIDTLSFLKELSFPTYFVKLEETKKFLSNFVIDNKNSEESIQYEKGKILRNILKFLLFLAFIVFIIVCYFK